MDNLIAINQKLAGHALGRLTPGHISYLAYVPKCLASLKLSAEQITKYAAFTGGTQNTIPVTALNRDYLFYARLVAKDIQAGLFYRLLELDITADQAKVVANLSDRQILSIATYWPREVVAIDCSILVCEGLDESTSKYHAASAITARTRNAPNSGPHPF